MDNAILTTVDVAEVFGVQCETVRDWIRRGDLVAEKKEGQWAITMADMNALREERENRSKPSWDQPELLGKTPNERWLLVATGSVWGARQDCKYCRADGAPATRMRVRVEQKIKGDRVEERARVTCGSCYANVGLLPRVKIHQEVWTSAPVMARVGTVWTLHKPVMQLVRP